MWKTLLAKLLTSLAPTLVEAGTSAIEKSLDAAEAKRKRRTPQEIYLDELEVLANLQSIDVAPMNENDAERHKARLVTQRAKVEMRKAMLGSPKSDA